MGLLSHLQEGVVLLEVLPSPGGEPEDLLVRVANGAFERHTGLAGVAGRRLSGLDPGWRRAWASLARACAEVARSGEPARFLQEVERTQAVLAVTAWRAGPGLVAATCEDVTDRRRADALRGQLEAQLRQAQKLESIGRLAGGIAHDFNNLLTVILSCAGAVEQEVGAGRPPEALDVAEIRRAGERARDLTRRLLAFMRRQDAAPVRLELPAAIAGVESLLRRVLGDDVELAVALQAGLWPVLLDPGLLEQVLLNLAVNARDAMPEGGRLLIEGRNEANAAPGDARHPAGEWVRLAVRDTGVGMPPEVRARLFEPFFTTKASGQGTGLGLPMVHGIVRQAGGLIQVQSAPGEGSAFELLLPRLATAAEAGPLPAPLPVAAPPGAGRERLLVVEDDPLVRRVLARILEGAGYQVHAEAGAADALARVADPAFQADLLVSDVQMPGQNGHAMARAMRRLRPGLRVLFVSGVLDAGLGQLLEGDAFLAKPFSQEGLLAQVRAALDRPAVAGAPAAPADAPA